MTIQFAARQAVLDLVPIADGWDRSWSFGRDGIEARCLLYFEASAVAISRLEAVALGLGVDGGAVRRWRAAVDGADAVGLTVNAALTSVRLYVQHWDQQVARIEAGEYGPFPLFAGFKSLPGGVMRDDIYLCTPLAPVDSFLPGMMDTLARFGADRAAMIAAFAGLTDAACIVTRTEGVGRTSWLVTVRKAPVDADALWRGLLPLGTSPAARDMLAMLPDHDLLHVAGGTDATKGDFLTIYLDCGPQEVAALLAGG